VIFVPFHEALRLRIERRDADLLSIATPPAGEFPFLPRPPVTTVSNAFYEDHAEQYAVDSAGIDLGALYDVFLPLVPPGGHLLDAGCGAGRDVRHFLDRGFRVTAFDASPRLVALATASTGIRVQCLRFEEMTYHRAFDGIWAFRSLLHVRDAVLPGILERFVAALRPGAPWLLVFKHGTGERVDARGRLFNDMDEPRLRALLVATPGIAIHRVWREDRPGRAGSTAWVNAIVRAAG
jgi:SAM-dependent methyltransferase